MLAFFIFIPRIIIPTYNIHTYMHTIAGSVLLYISWLVCLRSFIFLFTWDVVFLRGVFIACVCFFILNLLSTDFAWITVYRFLDLFFVITFASIFVCKPVRGGAIWGHILDC